MIAQGRRLVTRPSAVYAPCAVMVRISFIVMALAAGALRVSCLSLFVQTSDDLWPEWRRLTSDFPLPDGTEVTRLPPGFASPGDRAVLSLEGAGKAVGLMPLAPVVRLGDERLSATQAEIAAGAVRVIPLCAVSLPDLAIPVADSYPDQAGYPLSRNVTLQLDSHDGRLRAWYSKLPSPGPGTQASIAWIEAVGDVMPARGVDLALLGREGLEKVFGDTLALLRGSGLLLGNLESSTALGGAPQNKSYTFRFRGDAVGKLKEAGFAYLSLANNHTFDFGADGFLQTLSDLSRWGVATSGAGTDLQSAELPVEMKIGLQEVRILSFGAFPVERTGFDGREMERAGNSRPGILWLDAHGMAAAARAFAGNSAFTIGFVHGGEEWSAAPTSEQRRLYRELIRHGANLVLGAHPHVLQGMEVLGGSLIVYSLGNFVFPGMEGTPGGQDSVILRIGVYNGRVRYVQAIPVRLSDGRVRRAADGPALSTLLSRTRELAGVPPSEGWQKAEREVF
ncbi:MAG: CapA family protein [Spirochaetia bacterium]